VTGGARRTPVKSQKAIFLFIVADGGPKGIGIWRKNANGLRGAKKAKLSGEEDLRAFSIQ